MKEDDDATTAATSIFWNSFAVVDSRAASVSASLFDRKRIDRLESHVRVRVVDGREEKASRGRTTFGERWKV